VVTANLAYTGDLYAMPAALKHSVASYGGEPALIGLDWDNYLITNAVTGTTAKFLTSSPRTISICSDANYYLYTTYENEPIKLNLKVYIAGVPVINAFKTLTTGIDVFTRIGVGTKNINEWNASYLVGADYYTVQLTNNAGTALGEIFTFTIDCECSKWNETFRLHWLNPLGGFDAFTFVKRFDRTLNLKRASFKKILGSVDVAGAFTFAPSQAGKVAFDIHSTEQIKINSDNITEEQCNWIFTLAKSSQVFWEIDADTYAPVMITDSQYQQKTYAGQKLFNAHFTIEIGNDIISQRQ